MHGPEAALDAAVRAWNAGDLPGYLELYDPEIRLHGYAPEPMGRDAVRGFYEAVFAAFDGPRLSFEDVLWAGDRVAIRFTMTGTHVADFMGVPATDRAIALPGITILAFGPGERVVERWSQTDMLGLLGQIGALPAPAG